MTQEEKQYIKDSTVKEHLQITMMMITTIILIMITTTTTILITIDGLG